MASKTVTRSMHSWFFDPLGASMRKGTWFKNRVKITVFYWEGRKSVLYDFMICQEVRETGRIREIWITSGFFCFRWPVDGIVFACVKVFFAARSERRSDFSPFFARLRSTSAFTSAFTSPAETPVGGRLLRKISVIPGVRDVACVAA